MDRDQLIETYWRLDGAVIRAMTEGVSSDLVGGVDPEVCVVQDPNIAKHIVIAHNQWMVAHRIPAPIPENVPND
jgi:hypothetical protein